MSRVRASFDFDGSTARRAIKYKVFALRPCGIPLGVVAAMRVLSALASRSSCEIAVAQANVLLRESLRQPAISVSSVTRAQ